MIEFFLEPFWTVQRRFSFQIKSPLTVRTALQGGYKVSLAAGCHAEEMRKAVFLRFSCMKKHPALPLDKAGAHGYNIRRKGALLQQSDPQVIKIYL